jgi:hypothetical protein
MFKTDKINKVSIKPVINNCSYNPKKVKGYDMYPEPYANVALLAKKKSGKTNVIYRALENCVTKGTNVFIFSPTCQIDDTYKKMKVMLKKKGCTVVMKDHFMENGVDLIEQLLQIFGQKDKDEEEQDSEELVPPPMMAFPGDPNFRIVNPQVGGACTMVRKIKRKKKPEKPKKKKGMIAPEHILVFDDLSSDLRHKSISRLLTKNRHYKLKTFLACHSVNNLEKMALSCVDYLHVFGNVSDEKIEEIKDKMAITFKNDSRKNSKLQRIYDFATARPWSFLLIDRVNCEFRKNFNEIIQVPE